MEYSDIEQGLNSFLERYDSQTFIGSYRDTSRSSLLKDGLSTRANSLWKMAEYVVARYDNNTSTSIEQYIAGWRSLAERMNDQYLLIETSPGDWSIYDAKGNLLGNGNFINNFFAKKKREHLIAEANRGIQTRLKPYEGNGLQKIYYGAPGTGKSHTIKKYTNDDNAVRTTFHPDTDYSSFVGAYKPTTKAIPVRDLSGHFVYETFEDGEIKKHEHPVTEDQIVYEFVMQSFLQAYEKAWRKYIAAGTDGIPEAQYLVIEEINRGNCAQIFGDLFQLLDRNDKGFSDYPIVTDRDMQKQLAKVFAALGDIPNAEYINAMYKGVDICGKVTRSEVMILPSNLYIWATMNTSDQSLFPIDSAFKRRWDWEYMPITDATDENGKRLAWRIEANGKQYDWWEFLKRINAKISSTTNSEDKQLGYFFAKAKNGVISAETFVGKVIFFLWNDVFKDYETESNTIFEDNETDESGSKLLTFRKFYSKDGKTINHDKVELFLGNINVPVIDKITDTVPQDITPEDGGSNASFKVNGNAVSKVNQVPYTSVQEYVRLNPSKTENEILAVWKPFSKYSMRSWLVLGQDEYQSMLADEKLNKYAKYTYPISLTDGSTIYVNKDGWMFNDKIRNTLAEFIAAVNAAPLGVHIEVENAAE